MRTAIAINKRTIIDRFMGEPAEHPLGYSGEPVAVRQALTPYNAATFLWGPSGGPLGALNPHPTKIGELRLLNSPVILVSYLASPRGFEPLSPA
jgi:hypothetical protein